VVLVGGSDLVDGYRTDRLICRLSTGTCRLAVNIPDGNINYTEPGPAGIGF
jgi:hypothetical protein